MERELTSFPSRRLAKSAARRRLLPLTSIADDVATVKRAIALDPGPVLLVAHSYGGIVITEAGNDPKVSGLVYVYAYASDEGQSALSLNALAHPPECQILAEQLLAFFELISTRAGWYGADLAYSLLFAHG